jgi:glycerate kinase
MSLKILIAPDKFKGSLSALSVGKAIREGLLDVDGTISAEIVPLADGGEGTSDVLTNFSKGSFQEVEARDPLGRRIAARYGLSRDERTAFIEMASASGLHLLSASERNPMNTSTAGTGDLMRHALDRGVRHICVGIGGSATNDAGMGAMTALGVRFYDNTGALVAGRGADLENVDRIDIAEIHPTMRDASFTIFCDVDNPLYGAHGAAYVFGPQKGASPVMVKKLDEGLRHFEAVLQRHGYTNTSFPGVGAGGGFPLSLSVFGKAAVQPGINFIIEFVDLARHMRDADVIITGEGRLDEQTLSGKVVKGVAALAAKAGKPVVVVAGSASLGAADIQSLGIKHVISLVNDATSTEEAISRAATLIRQRVRENYPKIAGGQ